MKIIFFTQEDPFYVKVFFDEFFANCEHLGEIKAVVISHAMGKRSLFALAKQMYGLYGPFNFIRIGLKFVYYKLKSKKETKEYEAGTIPKTYSVKQTASAYGIKVIEHSGLNSDEFISLMKQYSADLSISIASPIIFKDQLIKTPKYDCINIHNAPLPKYRGMLPNFWQMYHGEKEVGISIHRIDQGIDTGDIIVQHFLPMVPDESLNDLIVRTKKENAWMIMDVIEGFRHGIIEYRKIQGKGSYFTFPKRKDVREFIRRGNKVI